MGTTRRNNHNRPGFFNVPMLYPSEYVWLVFISAMDLIMTWIIIRQHGGYESNPLAAFMISRFGSTGLVLFKFAIVIFVIVVCEILGRRTENRGRQLARFGVVVSALPLCVSLIIVVRYFVGIFFGGS